MYTFFLRDIPLSKIRHNDLPCYVEEGYGGRPIEEWPMYQFFAEYVHGEKELAREKFEAWYLEQLSQYHHRPKIEGGMYTGSLYTLIEHISGVPFSEATELHKREAIKRRVAERFDLLENIKTQGYRPGVERIDGIRKDGYVYLLGGHHRVAILSALGKEVLPQMMVFSNRFMYNLFTILRNIRTRFKTYRNPKSH